MQTGTVYKISPPTTTKLFTFCRFLITAVVINLIRCVYKYNMLCLQVEHEPYNNRYISVTTFQRTLNEVVKCLRGYGLHCMKGLPHYFVVVMN